MSQTLMAFLAMLIVSLLSFNQQRALLQAYDAMIDDELEVMASGVAMQAMEYIATQAFDDNAPVSTPTALTMPPFETGQACPLGSATGGGYDVCDDLDDFHQMQWEQVPFALDADTLFFAVRAEVYYLDAALQRISTPSYTKEVVVTVRDWQGFSGARPLMRSPVRLSRTFSYAP